MRNLTASFRSFLTEANGFYLSFISKLKNRFDLDRVDHIVLKKLDVVVDVDARTAEEFVEPAAKAKALMTCHRSLIFLGDLARYREIHLDKKEKNWAVAKLFYQLALRLIPANGNPFNQLAVIDTYEGDELGAVERYFRSLVIAQPFPTALENLGLLFRKARTRAENGKSKDELKTNDRRSSSPYSSFVNDFIVSHSYLFGKDTSVEAFFTHKSSLIGKFMDLLKTEPFPSELMMKVFAVNFGAAQLAQSVVKDTDTDMRRNEVLKQLILLSVDMACPLFHAITESAQRTRIDDMREGHEVEQMLPVLILISRWLLARAKEGHKKVLSGEHGLWTVYGMMLTVLAASAGFHMGMDFSFSTSARNADLQGFLPIIAADDVVNLGSGELDEDELEVRGDENTFTGAKQVVALGLELTKIQAVPLSVTSDPVNGNILVFQRTTTLQPKIVPPMNNRPLSTIAPPPGLHIAVGQSQPASDDEEEVILFTGRQRAATQLFQRTSSVGGLPALASPVADMATDLLSDGGMNRRSAIGAERRSSNGVVTPTTPVASSTSLLSGGISGAVTGAPGGPALPPASVTASALFGTGSRIWQSYGGGEIYPGNPASGTYMKGLLGVEAFTGAAGTGDASAAMSIPRKASSNAMFSFPNTPEAASSFGAGTDAVNTMAFLGLGSPANAHIRKGGNGVGDTAGGFGGSLRDAHKEAPGADPRFPGNSLTNPVDQGFSALSGFAPPPGMGLPVNFGYDHQQRDVPGSVTGQQMHQQQQEQWKGEYDFPFAGAGGGGLGGSMASPFTSMGWGNQGRPQSASGAAPFGDSMDHQRLSWLSTPTALSTTFSVAPPSSSSMWKQGSGGGMLGGSDSGIAGMGIFGDAMVVDDGGVRSGTEASGRHDGTTPPPPHTAARHPGLQGAR
ncbi:hypothetical protein HDV00_009483 [Rhizophlyctis rosea]|nr:hypothetical protein HDV00_009483 [Rhizophlyctis rosea]